MLDITLLGNYKIKSDGTQYTIFKEKEIDPTKSPNFKEGTNPDKYMKWESLGKYASTITRAIHIIINEEIHNSEAKDLAQIVTMIKDLEDKIEDALGGF